MMHADDPRISPKGQVLLCPPQIITVYKVFIQKVMECGSPIYNEVVSSILRCYRIGGRRPSVPHVQKPSQDLLFKLTLRKSVALQFVIDLYYSLAPGG